MDLQSLHDYAQTIQSWVASLTPEDLEREISAPIGDYNPDQFLEIFWSHQ